LIKSFEVGKRRVRRVVAYLSTQDGPGKDQNGITAATQAIFSTTLIDEGKSILRSIICILNSSAGARSRKASGDQIAEMFAQRNIPTIIWSAKSGSEIPGLVRRAVELKPIIIVAGGGDGTINCVASALMDTDIILGVLPMGTLNHFARDLRIPSSIDDAVAVVATGRIHRVDVGEVNGVTFLNNSSLGLYPRLVRERERLQSRGDSKWMGFAKAVGVVLLRTSQLHVRLVSAGGANIFLTTPFVFIGVNQYQISGWAIGRREDLDKGSLWLYSGARRGPLGLVALGLRALFARLDHKTVGAFETTECWIELRGAAVEVARDGEVSRMTTPLHYRIRPVSLRVMAPHEETAGPRSEGD
jgi:diacylglycerol kinase family enzyme